MNDLNMHSLIRSITRFVIFYTSYSFVSSSLSVYIANWTFLHIIARFATTYIRNILSNQRSSQFYDLANDEERGHSDCTRKHNLEKYDNDDVIIMWRFLDKKLFALIGKCILSPLFISSTASFTQGTHVCIRNPE